MFKYTCKRLLLVPVMLIFVSLITFWLVNLSHVEVAYTVLGTSATPSAVEQWNEQHGLDKPKPVQYLNYMKNIILHFDFGTSYKSGVPVLNTLKHVVWPTVRMSMMGFLFVVLLGVPLGVLCAVKQGSATDTAISVISMALTAVPPFLIGVVLMLVFSVKLHWLPTYGLNSWKSYIMPVLSGGLPGLTVFIRFTRSAMLDTIRQDYIRTERSKGHKEFDVIFGTALHNALLPIAAFIGSIFAGLLANSAVMELVFSINGIGMTVVTAINSHDTPVIIGCVLFLSTFYIIVTILVDLAFTLVDPRVKASFVKSGKIHHRDVARAAQDELDGADRRNRACQMQEKASGGEEKESRS